MALVWSGNLALPFAPKVTPTFQTEMQDGSKAWLAAPQSFDKFLAAGKAGSLAHVGVLPGKGETSEQLLFTLKNGERHSTALGAPVDAKTMESFSAYGAEVGVLQQRSSVTDLLFSLGSFVPMLLMGLFITGRIGPGAASRTSNAALESAEGITLRFSDVVGAEQAKASLAQIKSFLMSPEAYSNMGANPYRGVLLEGPPGTGKTLLAKALAGECSANFIAVDGSYFTDKMKGTGVFRVSALFKLARENAPCIVFIDEFDGIGKRSDRNTDCGAEDNLVINKLLVEMDGFQPNSGVIVLAATNHRAHIDEALLRDGRFDACVQVNLPTQVERRNLFDMYLGKVKTARALNTESLARMSSGMSPAAIAGVVNKAAVLAADTRASFVSEEHVLKALEAKQLGGDVNVSNRMTEKTRNRVAVHEAGHAIVGHFLGKGIVERVSIEPRGSALGVTYITSDAEESLFENGELTHRLAMLLAGRQAELRVLGNTSSGAADDLKRATELATNMVGHLGFSENFGLVSLAGLPAQLVSSDVCNGLLKEVSSLLARAQVLADECLDGHKSMLAAMTQSLLTHETIGAPLLKELFSVEG